MSNESANILKCGESQIVVDIGACLWERVKNGESIRDIILPHWIELVKSLLWARTGEMWEVREDYDDGISFQFSYVLDGFKCESICWTIPRIIEAFSSISEFIWEMTEWPIKKQALESSDDET